MNTIKCPNCGFENAFGLVFCTNCGTSLYSRTGDAGPETRERPSQPPTVEYRAPNTVSGKSGISPKVLMIGGIAALLLVVIGGVALSAFFYYLGTRNQAIANSNGVNANSNSVYAKNTQPTNTTVAKNSANNPVNANKDDDDYDDTNIEENAFTIPPSVGPFEQQETSIGDPGQDFPGAVEVQKAKYIKKGKEVELMVAKFNDLDAAKAGFDEYIKGLKQGGAKVIGKSRVKNRAGLYNGEISAFTFEKKWNALGYVDKHGIRWSAPDRYTFLEFSREFDAMFKTK